MEKKIIYNFIYLFLIYIYIYSQPCLKVYSTSLSIKGSFIFSLLMNNARNLNREPVHRGQLLIKVTSSGSIYCPLYTGLTVYMST